MARISGTHTAGCITIAVPARWSRWHPQEPSVNFKREAQWLVALSMVLPLIGLLMALVLPRLLRP